VPATHSMHPDFGLLCPTPGLRRRMQTIVACAVLAVIAIAVLRASNRPPIAMTRATGEDTVIGAQDARPAAMLALPSRSEAAQSEPDKIRCEQHNSVHQNFARRTWTYLDGKCVAGKARKPRIVRLPADRPALAAIALGHTSAVSQSAHDYPQAASNLVERQVEPSTSAATTSVPPVAAIESPPRPAATSKKPQKAVRRENRRRDPVWNNAPWREEARADGWGARGYGGGERDFGRRVYVREGFFDYMR
jgi:hypothetical protein